MKMSPRMALLVALMARTTTCFVPLSPPSAASSRFLGNSMRLIPSSSSKTKNTACSTTGSAKQKSSAMKMSFLGSDGGLLGIGAPEVVRVDIHTQTLFMVHTRTRIHASSHHPHAHAPLNNHYNNIIGHHRSGWVLYIRSIGFVQTCQRNREIHSKHSYAGR